MNVLVSDTSVLLDLDRELHDGLAKISKHPRCRLPKPEIRRRLARYADILR